MNLQKMLTTVFRTRNKHQLLSVHEKHYLKSKIDQDKTSISKLWQTYSISRSTLYSIRVNNRIDLENTFDIYKRTIQDKETNEAIEKIISNYLNDKKGVFTSKDIQFKLCTEYSINISLNKIRKLMKEQLNLSFKRINSRPSNIWLEKLKYRKTLCLSPPKWPKFL